MAIASLKHGNEIHGFYFHLSSILAGFLMRCVNLHPKKVKKCYFRFDNGVRKETIGFTNTSRHGSLLSSDALGTKINLHAPTTIAAFRNFCPKNIRDIFQFYVPMSKRLKTIKVLLVNQLLKLIEQNCHYFFIFYSVVPKIEICQKCFFHKKFQKLPLCYTWKVVLSLFGQKFWKMINNSIVFHCLKA